MDAVPRKYCIKAEDFSMVCGNVSERVAAGKKVWIFGKTPKGDIPAIETLLPPVEKNCCGLRIEAKFLSSSSCGKENMEAREVFSVKLLQQGVKELVSSVAGRFSYSDHTLLLESCARIVPGEPVKLVLYRNMDDEGDTFEGESIFAGMEITLQPFPEEAYCVENSPGYNSWPMCQTLGEKIVCMYCRGKEHDVFEEERAVYARSSSDHGKSWGKEVLICNTPGRGDVTIGKGLDENGDLLLWVRHSCREDGFRHRLYKSRDGKNFSCIAEPELPLDLVQITDIFHVPSVGLMALCFGGLYMPDRGNYWGKIISRDNGRTWELTVIEKDLSFKEWATEPSAVYLGEGKILVIARTEYRENTTNKALFQITSSDYGNSWKKTRTNITDITVSTPSLIYEKDSGKIFCYYFYRGRGLLNRRTAEAQYIFHHPLCWGEAQTVGIGSKEVCESGNVNAAFLGKEHILAYYSGTMPDTAVYVKVLSPPE